MPFSQSNFDIVEFDNSLSRGGASPALGRAYGSPAKEASRPGAQPVGRLRG